MTKHDSREGQLRETAERLLKEQKVAITGLDWWANHVVRLIDLLNAAQDKISAVYEERNQAAPELTALRPLLSIVTAGGSIVSSAQCSEQEIAWARAEGRMHVSETGIGYVARPKSGQ